MVDIMNNFEKVDLFHIFILYLIGMVISSIGGTAILCLLKLESGTVPYLLTSPMLAAILEPVFTKSIPALAVSYWATNWHETLAQTIYGSPLLLGIYGGFCVGIVEAFGKLVMSTGMYSGVNTVSFSLVAAVLLHTINGGIVGNAVFRNRNSRTQPWEKISVAVPLAVLLHLGWNGYHVIQLTEVLS